MKLSCSAFLLFYCSCLNLAEASWNIISNQYEKNFCARVLDYVPRAALAKGSDDLAAVLRDPKKIYGMNFTFQEAAALVKQILSSSENPHDFDRLLDKFIYSKGVQILNHRDVSDSIKLSSISEFSKVKWDSTVPENTEALLRRLFKVINFVYRSQIERHLFYSRYVESLNIVKQRREVLRISQDILEAQFEVYKALYESNKNLNLNLVKPRGVMIRFKNILARIKSLFEDVYSLTLLQVSLQPEDILDLSEGRRHALKERVAKQMVYLIKREWVLVWFNNLSVLATVVAGIELGIEGYQTFQYVLKDLRFEQIETSGSPSKALAIKLTATNAKMRKEILEKLLPVETKTDANIQALSEAEREFLKQAVRSYP